MKKYLNIFRHKNQLIKVIDSDNNEIYYLHSSVLRYAFKCDKFEELFNRLQDN